MIRNYKKISFVVLMTLSLTGCEDFRKLLTTDIYEPEFETRNQVVFKQLEESYNKQDFEQAFYYADLLAQQPEFEGYKLDDNLIESIYLKLAYMTSKGLGTEKNILKATAYYKKAMAYNNGNKAKLALGKMYLEGNKIEHAEGLELIKKSADSGYVNAISELAMMYQRGKFVPKDIVKSISYANKAAKTNDVKAMLMLVEVYLFEEGYIDYKLAKTISERISSVPKTAYNHNELGTNLIYLGGIYEYGLGVKKDVNKAVELYEKAVDLQNPQAMYIVGKMYEKGEYKEKNITKARDYYQNAAKLGSPEAKKAYDRLNK